jgi:glycosyltransferase involved in cell wall biosynthesis
VIIDSFSTDRTPELARQYGARFFQHAFEGHALQWLWGMRHVNLRYEWVFMHDPDHFMTPELRDELVTLFGRGVPESVDGLYVARRNIFQGRWIRYGGYYPKHMLKVVRAPRVSFDEHEFDYRAYVPGNTIKLRNDIIEENLKERDITWWIEKHNSFSTRQAAEEFLRSQRPDSWKTQLTPFGNTDQRRLWLKRLWYHMPLYIRPFCYYAYRYLIRMGFLDGKEGFIFHFLQGFWYRLLVDIKLDQLRTSEKKSTPGNASS